MKIIFKVMEEIIQFDIDIRESNTLYDLKKYISLKYKDKPIHQMIILHNRKKLNDDTKKLKDYGIEENDTVRLVLFLRGGK